MSSMSSGTQARPAPGHLLRTLACSTALRTAVLILIFSAAAVLESRSLRSLTDPSVWLQMRTGAWILDHHALPHSGLFSRFDKLSWTDPNWGAQAILALLYRLLGLRALPVAQMIFRALAAIGTFLLAGGRRGRFWLAVVLSIWAQAAMLHASQSQLLNVVLFSVELWVLFASRREGRQNLRWWVPFLVMLWANLDWHFVLGLLVPLVFLAAMLIEQALQGMRLAESDGATVRPGQPALVAAACCVASLLNPYSYHAYAVAWQNWFIKTAPRFAPELKSMNFRQPEHYFVMLLAMVAFLAIGRQRARDLFKVMLLAGCAVLGFAIQHEAWTMVVAAVAILGDILAPAGVRLDEPSRDSKPALWALAGVSLVLLGAAASQIPSKEKLLAVTAQKLPVRACDFIRQNHLPNPLFNEPSWGDFLTWYLPEYPVSMDGRYELYGEEQLKLYTQVTTGTLPPSGSPMLASANTVLVSKENGLVQGPQMFPDPEQVFQSAYPGFRKVYSDDLAVIWTNQQ